MSGEAAQRKADAWVRAAGIQGRAICMSYDSDGDGYVSCSLATQGNVVPLECAGATTLNRGCRVAKPLLHVGR